MAVEDYAINISVILAVLALLMAIGLLGGWKRNIDSVFSYLTNWSYFTEKGQDSLLGDSTEFAVEARVQKWEIYLPRGVMEWTEDIFYLTEGGYQADLNNLIEFYVPFSARLFKEHYTSVIESGRSCELELKIVNKKNGKRQWKRKRTFPVRDENGVIIGLKGFLRRPGLYE